MTKTSYGRQAMGELAPKLAQLTDDVLFGDIWARSELSPRERSLVTVAALVALYRLEQLPFHLGRAIDNGISRQELAEVITHLAFYSGWPTAHSAMGLLASLPVPAGRCEMPLSRITLRRGHDAAWLAALSDSLHQALVEAFEVPPADRFQIIDQKAAGERVFDRDYLAGPRSDDWVLFEITGGRPRGPAVKQAFYRRLADLLAVAPGIAAADIMVVITSNQPEDWSFGDGLATLLN